MLLGESDWLGKKVFWTDCARIASLTASPLYIHFFTFLPTPELDRMKCIKKFHIEIDLHPS